MDLNKKRRVKKEKRSKIIKNRIKHHGTKMTCNAMIRLGTHHKYI